MSRVISSAPELGVAGVDLVLLDVDRGQHVVAHEPLGEDDGVLVVVALPGHEGHEEVLAQRQLAVVGGRAVGQDVAVLDLVALVDQRALVDAGRLVGAAELGQPVRLAADARSSYSTVIVSPVTSATRPSASAMIRSPASRAARASTPVPM